MKALFFACCSALLLACNAKLADAPQPDMICGIKVAWYESTSASNPNAVDPNTPLTSRPLCCADVDLITDTANDGAVYNCCPAAKILIPTQAPAVSCCPSNLLGEVFGDDV